MIVAIHQPQYFPWSGYFDKMNQADIFVLLDNVQFKKNEWQNRNKIKTPNGWQWLTVPVKHNFGQKINEVEICNDRDWSKKHLNSFQTNYGKAMFYDKYISNIQDVLNVRWQNLASLNTFIIKKMKQMLNISTPVLLASQMGDLPEDPDERLIRIVHDLNAETYLAGIGGKDYMNLLKFEKAGINVIFQEYKHPVYQQLYDSYIPYLSAIDLIFNYGNKSLEILSQHKVTAYEYTGDWRTSR